MKLKQRPIVLVHGLWDNPSLFSNLIKSLQSDNIITFAPHLPHQLGKISILDLADELEKHLSKRFGSNEPIDILGYSMGGLISRVWLQELSGFSRTIRFFSVGSPHKGTLTAQLVPEFLCKGIAEMKIGSRLIFQMDSSKQVLLNLECFSFFTYSDLMVFPGWRGVLPCGSAFTMPVMNHKALITHPKSIQYLRRFILQGQSA